MEFFDVVSSARSRLPEFLRAHSFEELKRMIIEVEKHDRERFGFPKHLFNLYATANCNLQITRDYISRNGSDKESQLLHLSYELPTRELCRVLAALVAHAGSVKLREVAAGAGLLSKMLSYTVPVAIQASDKYALPGQTFVPVRRDSFEETTLEKGEDVVVAWLPADIEGEFLAMVERNFPENVWHIGRLAGACFSEKFVLEMARLGYGYIPVTAKQLSHIDHFSEEHEAAEGISRTSIAWFSRRPFPDDITAICSPADLARYRDASKEFYGKFLAEHYPPLTDEHAREVIGLIPTKRYEKVTGR